MIRLFTAVCAAFVLALPARAAIEITEVTSPGGITAWLVEEHEIPFVALEIRFKGGAVLDAPGKRGAINLMGGLLEEGAGDLDARGFAAAQEELAASFDFDMFNDGMTISARFLTENRDDAIALLRSALTEPRFDQSAIDRVRGQILSDLRFQENDPNEIVYREYSSRVFGDHPYGSNYEGTVDTVSGLTRDDILTAHGKVLTRDKVHVAAVGDITAEELTMLLDTLLGDLPASGPDLPNPADLKFPGGVTVVPFDTPQSVAFFGQSGIEWGDPDYFAAFVLMTIIGGGGFDSRLMEEVREKRGLTYGVYSYLSGADYADTIQGSLASSNARMPEAIEVIRQEWAKAAAGEITQEEVDLAKTFMTGGYPLRFDGNGRIASILANMLADDFPIEYPLTRNDQVSAVTLEDVQRVAQRLFDPEELSFIVVGQPVGLETTN